LDPPREHVEPWAALPDCAGRILASNGVDVVARAQSSAALPLGRVVKPP